MANIPQESEFDEEIFDIFVEEAGEVIEELDNNLPTWQADHANRPVLTEIRRAFHTLKGSGRMVKAFEIAEIAWKVEQALNRALDGGIAVSPALVDVVVAARIEIPPLITALKNRESVAIEGTHLARLCDRIDRVAKGETLIEVPKGPVAVAAAPAAPMVKPEDLEVIQVKMAELMKRVEACAGTAEEALGLSRKAITQIEKQEAGARNFVNQADLGKCRTQIQSLSTDLSDLRNLVKTTNDQLKAQKSDGKQDFERRFSEERTTFALVKTELANDILRLQQQLNDTRKWGLTLAGAVAGAAFLFSLAVMLWMK